MSNFLIGFLFYILKFELKMFFKSFSKTSEILSLELTKSQSDTIKIPNSLIKGDKIFIESQFILFISDISLNIDLGITSLKIKSSQLTYEWTSDNYLEIGIEIGKIKPLLGFEVTNELLLLIALSIKILYRRKVKQ